MPLVTKRKTKTVIRNAYVGGDIDLAVFLRVSFLHEKNCLFNSTVFVSRSFVATLSFGLSFKKLTLRFGLTFSFFRSTV
jgi:hypothetical protein